MTVVTRWKRPSGKPIDANTEACLSKEYLTDPKNVRVKADENKLDENICGASLISDANLYIKTFETSSINF